MAALEHNFAHLSIILTMSIDIGEMTLSFKPKIDGQKLKRIMGLFL